jgi:hypothetical protein
MNGQININSLYQTVLAFIRGHIIFIAPAVLILFFIFIVLFSYTSSTVKPKIKISPVPTKTQASSLPAANTNLLPTQQEGLVSDGIAEEENDMGWSPVSVSDADFQGVTLTKTVFADGSIQYTSASSARTGSQNVTIVKDSIIIFQSKPMVNVLLSDYKNFFGAPQYKAIGSKFWGPNVITYIYLNRGAALMVDPSTNKVLVQMTFKPVSKDLFKSTYRLDLIGELQ